MPVSVRRWRRRDEDQQPVDGIDENFVQFAADRDDEKSRFALSRLMECVERIREITYSTSLLDQSCEQSCYLHHAYSPEWLPEVLNTGDDLVRKVSR